MRLPALTFVTLRVLVFEYGEFVDFAELLEQRHQIRLLQVARNAADEQLGRASLVRKTAAGRFGRRVRDAQRGERRLHWIEGIHHFFRHLVARTNTHQNGDNFGDYIYSIQTLPHGDDLKTNRTHRQVTGLVSILPSGREPANGIKRLPKLSRLHKARIRRQTASSGA